MPRKPRTPVWSSVEEQFNAYWEPVPEAGCWIWTAACNGYGYGMMKVGGRKGKTLRAHRVSYEIHKGKIPKGGLICHRCDTPACVNPDHLFLGDRDDNAKDKQFKGRAAKKLTEQQVREIRTSDLSQRELGRIYGVSHPMIGYIKRGQSWNHLE